MCECLKPKLWLGTIILVLTLVSVGIWTVGIGDELAGHAVQPSSNEMPNSNPYIRSESVTTPTATAPVATAPVATAPVATALVATAPAATAPVATAPVATAPVATVPAATAPVATAPVATAPVATAPVATGGIGKKVALVIGNNLYQQVRKLTSPTNDATDIANALKSLGFEVTLLTDATKEAFDAAIKQFGSQAQGANVALLYFSGHGLQIGGENILIPVDYALANPEGGVSAHALQKIMQDATTGTKILILDACRNEEKTAKAGLAVNGLAPMIPLREFIVMYATAAGATAADGSGRNSPYTAALLQHIKEPIPIETLFKRVAITVEQNTQPPQLPANYTAGLTGDFCFTGCGVSIDDDANTCHINIGKGVYEGECQDGKANGQGVQRYADGEYYAGNFRGNLRNGYGTQYLTDGTEIAGYWKKGRLVGDR